MVARTKWFIKPTTALTKEPKKSPSKYGQMKFKKSLFIIGLNSICYFREHYEYIVTLKCVILLFIFLVDGPTFAQIQGVVVCTDIS